MKKKIFTLIAVLAFIPAAYPQVLGDYEKRITEHTLSNGMHFIILQDHTAPVVTFHVQVNTGSVDEKYGETGISHLIEHLAFNGTARIGTTDWNEEKRVSAETDRIYEKILDRRREGKDGKDIQKLEEEFRRLKEKAVGYEQPNEFGKILDAHGAVGPNAYTGNDLTVYWVELPSNKTELWALLESDRLFNPVFRAFYEELEVVKEERRMRIDNSPWGKLTEEFHGAAYMVHPYRNPVVGYPADLQDMTRSKVKNFYAKHYVPSNVIAVIVGDVNPGQLIPVLESYFGGTAAGIQIPSFIPPEPPQGKTEKKVLIKMQSEPIFLTGFHIPDANHPDIPALEVCAEILSGGRTSRLYRTLVTDKRIALSTGTWCRSQKYPGMFYVWAIAAKGHTNGEMETAVCEEIEKIKAGEIKPGEMEGAKARLKMEFLTGLSSRMGLASELASYQSITGDWRNMFAYTEKIDKVTEEDIKRAMAGYFLMEKRVTGTVERE